MRSAGSQFQVEKPRTGDASSATVRWSGLSRLLRNTAPVFAAIAGVVAATVLRSAAYPVLADRTPFLFYFIVVVAVALYRGFWPGAVALILSCLVVMYGPLPAGDGTLMWGPYDPAKVLAFVIGGVVIVILADAQLRARRRAEMSQRQAERTAEALRESESLLTTTLRSIGDAVITTDVTGGVTMLNPIAERLTGWRDDEARGRPAREIFRVRHEETGAELENPIVRVMRGVASAPSCHALLVARDGVERPIDESAAPIQDGNGGLYGAVLVFRDVTARRQADEALRRRTEELRALVENSPDVIIRYDAALRRVYVSPAAIRIFGIPAEQLIGTGAVDGFSPIDRDAATRWECALRRVFESGEETAFETVVHSPGGDCLTFEARLVPEFAADCTVASVLAIARDVSEAVRARAELADFLERQRRIAETLQRSLLVRPSVTGFDDLQIGSAYEAAWDEAYVGGDFYDVVRLNDREVALLVGDVSGKGLHAAAQTAEIKFALRAYLSENPDPGRALGCLNRFLCGDGPHAGRPVATGTRVAVAIVILDCVTGCGRAAASAAEPPLILHPLESSEDKPVVLGEELVVNGTVLGMDRAAAYDTVTFQLGAQDILLLLTDGITEARHENAFFGIEGVARAAGAALHTGSLDALCHGVIAEAKAFTAAGRLRDDACLLAVSRR